MVIENEELVREFVVESAEHLAAIESQLLEIESAGANLNRDLVNTVFRNVHSIKGAASFFGLNSISELSHHLENILNRMREGKLIPKRSNVEPMLRAADLLRSMIDDVGNSNQVDPTVICQELDLAAADQAPAISEPAAPTPTPTPSAPAVTVAQEVSTPAQVSSPQPNPTPAPPPMQTSSPVRNESVEEHPERHDPVEAHQRQQEQPKAHPADSAKPAGESSIRVTVEVLDQLMNLAGEMVLGRNQLMQSVYSSERVGLESVAARINQITSELQDAIMRTRMQPIGNVFTRFTRIVRDLSQKLGKQCQLVIEGKDVEVDKTIIEAIGDPLTHLIRNAVDHGLEMPAGRQKSGKTPCGTIHLKAYHQSGRVRIDIQDDGKGMDPQALKSKAVEKGLLSADDARDMSDADAYRLIFLPGFSTAEKLSDISGRGVGMDVVRTNIEKLGGSVEIESVLEVGTTIHVSLPLTLAIIPSLIVKAGTARYAIPQVNILELVRLKPNEIEERINRVQDAEVLRLRGTLLPVVRLHDALGNPQDPKNDGRAPVNIIVVEAGKLRYGLIVDALADSEEIVVKPLGRHLTQSRCFNGATILGDGRVALIVDVAGIASQSQLHEIASSLTEHAFKNEQQLMQGQAQRFLFFTNHPSEWFAVPMGLISRIERISLSEIKIIGGKKSLQHRGTSLLLIALEDAIKALPRTEENRVFVIVFRVGDKEAGLIAPNLEDIRAIAIEPDDTTLIEPGVIGSFIHQEKTIRLLDLQFICQQCYPTLSTVKAKLPVPGAQPKSITKSPVSIPNAMPMPEVSAPKREAENRPQTLLLAEDSNFFRKQVKTYFEAMGLQVSDYVDGQAAWNALRDGLVHPDLVVTDIEMPNMNGLQLCRAIRGDARFRTLPVIALTSLAGEDDIRAGKAAGIDEYQVKLDREQLTLAAQRLLTDQPKRTNLEINA